MTKPRLTEVLKNIYSIVTNRTWAVYDPADMFILHVGKRRDCLRIQDENYGGLIVIPVDSAMRDSQSR